MLYCCTYLCMCQRCINFIQGLIDRRSFISIDMWIWYIDVDWDELATRSEGRDQSGFFLNLKCLNLAANMLLLPSQLCGDAIRIYIVLFIMVIVVFKANYMYYTTKFEANSIIITIITLLPSLQ